MQNSAEAVAGLHPRAACIDVTSHGALGHVPPLSWGLLMYTNLAISVYVKLQCAVADCQ